MKIAMMTNNYLPVVGGVPVSIQRLSHGLMALGHEVVVFAPAYQGHEKAEVDEAGMTIYRYHSSASHSIGRHLSSEAVIGHGFDHRIEDWLLAFGPDIIHDHHPFLIGSESLHLKKKYHIPVCYTYHTRYEQYLHYLKPYAKLEQAQPQMLQPIKESAIHTIQDKALPFYIRSFANRCDMVFAPTDSMGNHLKNNKVTTPIRVLPTGLSDTSFSPDMEAAMALREKHAQGRPFLLCTVSRLAEEKNISFLLRGLAVLKEIMGGTFRCVIIGSGPQSVELRAFADKIGIAGSVDFVGSIPNEKLPNYHAASDLFLFASQTETQGIVLLEAMAAGKPVVAIDATGSCDVINNGVNGFLTRPSEADWAGAAAQLLQDGRKRAAFSAAARETASAYHSTQIAQKAAFHYRSLL